MERDSTPYFSGSKNVKDLSPKDFSGSKAAHLKDKSCSVVLFYLPWCSHCKAVKEDWEKLGKTALFTNVLALNCEKYSSHLEKIREELPELVRHFPTIVFYKNGVPSHQQPETEREYKKLLKACMEFCKGR